MTENAERPLDMNEDELLSPEVPADLVELHEILEWEKAVKEQES